MNKKETLDKITAELNNLMALLKKTTSEATQKIVEFSEAMKKKREAAKQSEAPKPTTPSETKPETTETKKEEPPKEPPSPT